MCIKSILTFLTLGLCGCQIGGQTSLNPKYAEKTNQYVTAFDGPLHSIPRDESVEKRLAVLFADQQEIVSSLNPDTWVGKVRTAPRIRKAVAPKYPLSARSEKKTVEVKVAFIVDKTGAVQEARILECSDDRFASYAITAVKRWTFDPGIVDGEKVNTMVVTPIVFVP